MLLIVGYFITCNLEYTYKNNEYTIFQFIRDPNIFAISFAVSAILGE